MANVKKYTKWKELYCNWTTCLLSNFFKWLFPDRPWNGREWYFLTIYILSLERLLWMDTYLIMVMPSNISNEMNSVCTFFLTNVCVQNYKTNPSLFTVHLQFSGNRITLGGGHWGIMNCLSSPLYKTGILIFITTWLCRVNKIYNIIIKLYKYKMLSRSSKDLCLP